MRPSRFALVKTRWGVAGVVWTDAGVTHFVWPRASARQARQAVLELAPDAVAAPPTALPVGLGELIRNYFAGRRTDFSSVRLDLSGHPPFRAKVLAELRCVGYGRTVSYGELARRVGRPGAARAVGQAVARNPIPVLVPCHRVLRTGGALGGFSADGGTATKSRLLAMEQA